MVNELSPAGKCQTRAVWKKIENQKFGFGSGVLPRRRREKGSPHQRILHWRAKQARKHMSMSLHDNCSELPDDTHFAVIDDDFEEESDKAIQKDKNRRLELMCHVLMFHQDEQAQIRPRSGEFQGDSAMPDDFKECVSVLKECFELSKSTQDTPPESTPKTRTSDDQRSNITPPQSRAYWNTY